MVTHPNTSRVFERTSCRRRDSARQGRACSHGWRQHERAGGHRAPPAEFGVDVAAPQPHKTFSTPPAAEGRAQVPVAVKKPFEPFLPVRRLKRSGKKGGLRLPPQTLQQAACAPSDGLRRAGARRWLHPAHGWPRPAQRHRRPPCSTPFYIPQSLEPYFDLPVRSPNMHEVVFSAMTGPPRSACPRRLHFRPSSITASTLISVSFSR